MDTQKTKLSNSRHQTVLPVLMRPANAARSRLLLRSQAGREATLLAQLVLRTQAGRREKEVTMKIRDQEITLPTSMVGNYPNPRWWDAYFARHWTGGQRPPDSLEREPLEDEVLALAHEQEHSA